MHGKIKRVRVCTKPKPKPKPKPAPKVLNVSLSLDSTHSTSVVVGKAGGTVTAHEADGSALTLSVPAGALASDTTISLTPIDSLRGLPKGLKLGGGVQFGPEGLALEHPATVSFVGGAGAKGIAWFAAGKALSRYPSTRSGSTVTMRVTHFSGVGAVTGPASAYSSIPAAIAALKVRYTSTVRPLLQQAVTNDAVVGRRSTRLSASSARSSCSGSGRTSRRSATRSSISSRGSFSTRWTLPHRSARTTT